MINKIISKKSTEFSLCVKKPTDLANERKLKIVTDSLVIKGQTFESVNSHKFLKNLHETKTNECLAPCDG